ncbi:MAG: aminotransferase class III-fold pyridoxal phosphate-dependent enzyme, partial [Verrucomicrobia bacterium]
AYRGLLFKTDALPAPYCYRCPFNRARPEPADARAWRRCRWECLDQVERRLERQRRRGEPYAAVVVEPLLQGAAGMVPQPRGWLARVAEMTRAHGALLIADEVFTGFGRAGVGDWRPARRGLPSLFACHQEGVQPDIMALAKGLTGGYLPLAATLVSRPIFDAFLGDYAEFKTFFHGHSYTGNQLGAAAALASLDLLETRAAAARRARLEDWLAREAAGLWRHRWVGDIRQVGLVVAVELVRDRATREPFDLREQTGIRVCRAMARRGVLTRPIGNVVPVLPPYVVTRAQVGRIFGAFGEAIEEVLGR